MARRSRSSSAWLSAQTMSAPAPGDRVAAVEQGADRQRLRRADRVEAPVGAALGHRHHPAGQVAHVDHLRARARIARRQHRAALRDPRRPVGEAVGGIVGPHDQARPHDQRAVAELVLDRLLAERLQRPVAGLGDLLDRRVLDGADRPVDLAAGAAVLVVHGDAGDERVVAARRSEQPRRVGDQTREVAAGVDHGIELAPRQRRQPAVAVAAQVLGIGEQLRRWSGRG